MARKKIVLDDPANITKVEAYINEKARRSTIKGLPRLLSIPQTISPRLRGSGNNQPFEITSVGKTVGAAAHLRGELAQNPCQNCKAGLGPFEDCVILPSCSDMTKGCTNCTWDGNIHDSNARNTTCDFVEARTPIQRSWKRLPKRKRAQSEQEEVIAGERNYHSNAQARDSSSIRLLGDLIMPPIPAGESGWHLRELFNAVQADVAALDSRDMSEIHKSISDIDTEYLKFKATERQAWIDSGQDAPSDEYLVRPSGSLSSTISHRLNQPSYTTNKAKRGQTADLTNGCIAMVMGTAYNEDTLLYDQYHRRSYRSEAEDEYPEAVLRVHHEWTRRIFESSESKVEALYGLKTCGSITRERGFRATALPLWGPYEGVVLLFVHESMFRNAQNQYRFRKALILCYHPQFLFWDSINGRFVTRQERNITAASAIARVSHIQNYFQHKKWNKLGISSHKRHVLNLVGSSHNDSLTSSNQILMNKNESKLDKDVDPESRSGSWETSFSKVPHSNIALRDLLPAAIEMVEASNDDWSHPCDFPTAVQEWWTGQKSILFHSRVVSGLDDVIAALTDRIHLESPTLSKATTTLSLRSTIQRLMNVQQNFFSLSPESDLFPSKWAHLVYSRCDGQSMNLVCIECRATGKKERFPLFAVNQPNFFVKRRYNVCEICRDKKGNSNKKDKLGRRFWVPEDPEIEVIKFGSSLELLDPKPRLLLFQSLLQPSTSNLQPISSHCIRCRENTRLLRGDSSLIDYEPRWSYGLQRPLYLERKAICATCRDMGRAAGRFVPMDANIPSIEQGVLSRLAEVYGEYEDNLKALLLDSWPPSSKRPRSEAQSSDG